MKKAMDDKKDPYLAVLDHRNTPTQGFTTSPAQRMFSRRTKTLLPRTTQLLNPEIIPREVHRSQRIQSQKRQEKYFNRTAHDLNPFEIGDNIRIQPYSTNAKVWKHGVVLKKLDERSYEVECDGRDFRSWKSWQHEFHESRVVRTSRAVIKTGSQLVPTIYTWKKCTISTYKLSTWKSTLWRLGEEDMFIHVIPIT